MILTFQEKSSTSDSVFLCTYCFIHMYTPPPTPLQMCPTSFSWGVPLSSPLPRPHTPTTLTKPSLQISGNIERSPSTPSLKLPPILGTRVTCPFSWPLCRCGQVVVGQVRLGQGITQSHRQRGPGKGTSYLFLCLFCVYLPRSWSREFLEFFLRPSIPAERKVFKNLALIPSSTTAGGIDDDDMRIMI